MTQLNPYLTFNGNAREAVEFYKECFGGDLTIQTVGESPMADQMPDMKNQVMHADLKKDGQTLLFASDMVGESKLVSGNSVTLCINCSSDEEIKGLFDKLSKGGTVSHELKEEFWGDTYGDFTDKFGVRWMLNYHKAQ
ncbi:MAG: VOC family protein [bacterium]|nr:VOC family protein [bacterium]